MPAPSDKSLAQNDHHHSFSSDACSDQNKNDTNGQWHNSTGSNDISDPTGATDALSAAEISELRQEIDRLDHIILDSVQRRTEISRMIGATRKKSGGPKLVHTRELKVIERFSPLGKEGHQLALLLLRLGRGPLG